jgi:hypothetical protein
VTLLSDSLRKHSSLCLRFVVSKSSLWTSKLPSTCTCTHAAQLEAHDVRYRWLFCISSPMAAVFDGPPTIINYMGATLIVDSTCVRRFDGKCLASVPDFTWLDESQRKLASILHHGSH